MYKQFFLLILCCVSQYESSRILAVIPTPSISHQVTFRPLTQELARRGHEVVVITADPAFRNEKRPENLTEIDVHDISYKLWNDEMTKDNIAFGDKYDLLNQINIIFDVTLKVFENQMLIDDVQKIIKKETKPFDLILIEAFILPTLGFSHIYKVPVIQMSSFLPVSFDLNNVGAPDHPFLYPTFGNQNLDDITLIQKFKLLCAYFFISKEKYESAADKVVKTVFGPNVPPLTELYNNIDMLFLNTFPIWDSNRPVPPNVQYIGGIHIGTPNQLPQELQTYLDSSKHGVIYLSFGTNVNLSMLPPEKIQIFLNVLSHSHYDVIWKWDKEELPGRSENIKISKWLPQSDLLRHPKVKLFITQGGLQSTDEAIIAGVPLLGIPLLGDQWYNTAMYKRHQIGLKIEMDDLSEVRLKSAIDVLTKDDVYRQNIIKFRSIIYDQPQRALDRAVWWTEHVLRHGGARHLRAPAANLPWTSYYEVENLVYLLLIVVSILYMLSVVVFKISKLFMVFKLKLN